MSSQSEAAQATLAAEIKKLAEEGRTIAEAAKKAGRNLTDAETKKVTDLLVKAELFKTRLAAMRDNDETLAAIERGATLAVGTPTIPDGTRTGNKSLWGATLQTGLKIEPGGHVLKRLTSGAKETMDLLDDPQTDLPPKRLPGIQGIPTVERYLFRQFAAQDIADDVALVEYLRQVSRDLPGASSDSEDSGGSVTDTILDFASTNEKAKAGTKVKLETAEPKMNAVVTDYIPNALAGRADLRGLVDSTCTLALNRGLDAYVTNLVLDDPDESELGSDLIESIVYARQKLRDGGYTPRVTLVSSNDATSIELARGNVEGAFFGSNIPDLGTVVISDAVMDGAPLVIDTQALGDLFIGGLVVDADSLTEFSTNQTRFRYEHPTLFVVRDKNAAVIVDLMSA